MSDGRAARRRARARPLACPRGPVLLHGAGRSRRRRHQGRAARAPATRRAAWGPPFRDGESAYYLCVNRGKRSVTVDLGDPAGVEVAERLALDGRRRDRELPPGRRRPPRPRLRGALGCPAADRLHIDRRLLARERRRAPPGLRLRDPGRGGRHVDHGRAGWPAAQGRRRDRGHHDRDVRERSARWPRCATPSATGQRPPRPGQPLRLAAGLAREPRLRLARRGRGAAAARQRPPGDRPVRGLRDQRRSRHRRHRHERAVRALLHRGRAAPIWPATSATRSNALRVEHRLELVGAARGCDPRGVRRRTGWRCSSSANVPGGPVRTIPEAFAHAPYAVVEHAAPAARQRAHRALADRPRRRATPRRPRAPPLLGQHTGEVLAELGYDERRARRATARGLPSGLTIWRYGERPAQPRGPVAAEALGWESGWLAPYLPLRSSSRAQAPYWPTDPAPPAVDWCSFPRNTHPRVLGLGRLGDACRQRRSRHVRTLPP